MTYDIKEAALQYAARGWMVIPLHGILPDGSCTCKQGPTCETAGKHPILAGQVWKYGTTDPGVIAGWWAKWPNANVGIVCGEPSGLWVLDMDGAEGRSTIDQLEEHERPDGPLPTTVMARTGGGGIHWLWRWNPGDLIRTRTRVHPGVDVKANGFIVAPPSAHRSGNVYSWINDPAVGLRDAPRDIVAWVKVRSNGDGSEGGGGVPEFPSVAEMLRDGLPQGRRDDGIFHAAVTLLKSGMPPHDVQELCRRIADQCVPPFPREDADGKVRAAIAFRAGREDGDIPRWAKDWVGSIASKGATDEASGSQSDPLGSLWPGFGGLTDLANADRLSSKLRDHRPVNGSEGLWLRWDGQLWRRSRRPVHEAGDLLRAIITQEIALCPGEVAVELAKHRRRSEGTGSINAALAQMETDPEAWIELSELDANDMLLCVKNGVLDLSGDEPRLLSFDEARARGEVITRQADVEWHGGLDAVGRPDFFLGTLRSALRNEDPAYAKDVHDALQIFLGLSLTGIRLKNFVVLYGPGNTGKSSVIEAWAQMLGGYATGVPRNLFTQKVGKDEGHPTIVTELEGRRFAYAAEPAAGDELNTQFMKDVTGGLWLQARKMREDFYTFRSVTKPLIDTNHPLRLRDVSAALEQRMIELPMRAAVPGEVAKARDEVDRLMAKERSALLAWGCEGLRRWKEAGSPGDMSVMLGLDLLSDRMASVSAQDVVGQWINECLVEEEGGELWASDIGNSFMWWTMANDVTFSVDAFKRELKSRLQGGVGLHGPHRYRKARRNGVGNPVWVVEGVRLRDGTSVNGAVEQDG